MSLFFAAACLIIPRPSTLPAELDITEPSAAVRALVQAFEVLRSCLAAAGGDSREAMMQAAWSAVMGHVLKRTWDV